MKWVFIIRQKIRVAFLLACIMALVGLTNLLERRNVEQLNQSFSSIYHDRLIPATDIFYLADHLYHKQLLMEHFLFTDPSMTVASLEDSLGHHNRRIESLISKFSNTYLVQEESCHLEELRSEVHRYNELEQKIVSAFKADTKEAAVLIYEKEGRKDLDGTIQQLGELTRIQSSVGLALMRDSNGIASSSNLVLTLQISVAIVIGLIIQSLVMASNLVETNKQNFHLN